MAAEDWIDVDDWDDTCDEPSFIPDRKRNLTCKHCGESGFHWGQIWGTWRLFDSNEQLHTCKKQSRPGWTADSLTNLARSFSIPTTQAFDVPPLTNKEPIMDKNAVAFIRNDVVSLGVQFPANGANSENLLDPKIYTYLTTDRSLSVGDWVIVQVGEVFKCARVVRFTNELEIEPNATFSFKYIVGRVDPSQYIATLEANAKIEEMLKTSYRSTLREGFRHMLLAGLDAEKQASISLILSSKE